MFPLKLSACDAGSFARFRENVRHWCENSPRLDEKAQSPSLMIDGTVQYCRVVLAVRRRVIVVAAGCSLCGRNPVSVLDPTSRFVPDYPAIT